MTTPLQSDAALPSISYKTDRAGPRTVTPSVTGSRGPDSLVLVTRIARHRGALDASCDGLWFRGQTAVCGVVPRGRAGGSFGWPVRRWAGRSGRLAGRSERGRSLGVRVDCLVLSTQPGRERREDGRPLEVQVGVRGRPKCGGHEVEHRRRARPSYATVVTVRFWVFSQSSKRVVPMLRPGSKERSP